MARPNAMKFYLKKQNEISNEFCDYIEKRFDPNLNSCIVDSFMEKFKLLALERNLISNIYRILESLTKLIKSIVYLIQNKSD